MAKNERVHRISVVLTPETFKLLQRECDRLRREEGCRVPPTRIVNDLILRYLSDQEHQAVRAAHGDRGEHPKVIKTAARGEERAS